MGEKPLVIRDGLDSRSLYFRGVEKGIIRSAEFQRLNYINNLGCGYLLYPNAQLKRFSHCIGSAELGRMFAKRLGLGEHEKNLLVAALLMHDLGHGPFSHATDKHCSVPHDGRTIGIITGEMPMPRAYCGEIPKILRLFEVNPHEIASVLNGTHPSKALCALVSGYFDLDKGDYLRRDSYATGAKMGDIDIERMCDVMTMHEGDLCLLEKGFDSMVSFIHARKNMYRNVYRHRRTAVFEAMLNLAVDDSKLEGSALWYLTDGELLDKLSAVVSASSEIVGMMKANVSYERVYGIRSNGGENLAAARHLASQEGLASRIAKDAGLAGCDVLVIRDIPKEGKEPYFPMLLEDGRVCNVFDYDNVAREIDKQHTSQFYFMAAVHPHAEKSQMKKAASMMESIAKEVK